MKLYSARRQGNITQIVKQVERAICSNERKESMEFFPNCTHPKCLCVTLVKMKNDFSGPACVLYANTKSSTLYGLRHLDRDSVLLGVQGTREMAKIFSTPEITNMPATQRVHSFSVNEDGNGVTVLDISETWRARN